MNELMRGFSENLSEKVKQEIYHKFNIRTGSKIKEREV
jgi:hypothetical protein